MDATDLTQMNTRIPVALKERLEASAKESRRTLNAEVIALLEEALEMRARNEGEQSYSEYLPLERDTIKKLLEVVNDLESTISELSNRIEDMRKPG
jgi:hypothetical protein